MINHQPYNNYHNWNGNGNSNGYGNYNGYRNYNGNSNMVIMMVINNNGNLFYNISCPCLKIRRELG